MSEGKPAGRPLVEQFNDLPESAQSRLFRVLDVILGMDHEEKETTRRWFYAAERTDEVPPEVRKLAGSVRALTHQADRLAKGDS